MASRHGWQRVVFYVLCAPGLVLAAIELFVLVRVSMGLSPLGHGPSLAAVFLFLTSFLAQYTTVLALVSFVLWRKNALAHTRLARWALGVCIIAVGLEMIIAS